MSLPARERDRTQGPRVVETPIVEFLQHGERVATVNVRLSFAGGAVRLSLHTVPATRLGRSLPDWPRALSLRPDLEQRQN